MKRVRPLRYAFAVLLALCAALNSAGAAFAQAAGPSLIISDCDSANYPQVTCTLAPLNAAGVPLQDLTKAAFEVVDGNDPVRDYSVERVAKPDARTSYMLVVDFGMFQRGQNLQALKDAARGVLSALGSDDRVGMIGVTGKVEVDGSKLDPGKESGFVNAGSNRNDVINQITALNAVPGTPLYDAVCKALLLTARESSPGNRAVIVISDGRDATSSVCKDDDPIQRAARDRIPVFTVGVGNNVNENYLKRLAIQTDGTYLPAAAAGDIRSAFDKIQALLKTRYRLSFNGATAGDNKSHPFTVRLTVPSGRVSERAEYVAALPIKPTLDVRLKVGDAAADPAKLPFDTEITVEPTIAARRLARVEYVLNGSTTAVTQAPYTFKFNTSALDPARPIQLEVRAIGDPANPQSITSKAVDLRVEAPPTPIPTPTPSPSGLANLTRSPIFLGGIGLLALLLIGLIVLLVLRSRRPKPAVYEPVTSIGLSDATSIVGVGDAAAADHTSIINLDEQPKTLVFGAGEGEAPKTMVYRPGLAILEVTSGTSQGAKCQIGVPGDEGAVVGRKTDGATVQLQIDSPYISRKHARITAEGETLYIEDLGSASGTRVNGTRISGRVAIKVGDQIEFADVKAEVKPLS